MSAVSVGPRPVIRTRGLTKRYGELRAVDAVDLAPRVEGELHAHDDAAVDRVLAALPAAARAASADDATMGA